MTRDEAPKEILERIVLAALLGLCAGRAIARCLLLPRRTRLSRADVDDRRALILDELREIGKLGTGLRQRAARERYKTDDKTKTGGKTG